MRSTSFAVLGLLVLGCSAAPDESDGGTGGAGASGGSTSGGAASSAGTSSNAGTTSGGAMGTSGGSGGAATGGTTANSAGGTSAGTAGSSNAGTGGTAPHVVVPCDSAEVGVWEEITPPDVLADGNYSTQMGFGVNAFVIDSQNTANIVLGSDHIGVYRTTDCGASWAHINTGENAATLDGGTQWSMDIDPVDPNIIYTVAGYGTNGVFKTTNGGVDWKQTLAPEYASIFVYGGFTAQVRIDPTNHEHLVITPHFTCTEGHSETCFLETEDGGTTWNAVEETPSSGEGARILLVDHDTWFSGLGYGGLYRTSDAGLTWTNLTSADSYAYEVFHRAGGKYYLPTAFGLSASEDGITWSGLENGPGTTIVTTSDTHIYAATGGHCISRHDELFSPITVASIDAPTTWTIDTSYTNHYGSGDLKYDLDHHMLYSSNCNGGFWRVRTE